MIIQPLRKFRERLGKFYLPVLMFLFFLFSIGIMYTSVKQNNVDYSEGQVAEENIRANKTIENTAATEQNVNWLPKLYHQSTRIRIHWRKRSMIVSIIYLT